MCPAADDPRPARSSKRKRSSFARRLGRNVGIGQEVAARNTKVAAFALGKQVGKSQTSADRLVDRQAFESGLPIALTLEAGLALLHFYSFRQQYLVTMMAEAMMKDGQRSSNRRGASDGERHSSNHRVYQKPDLDPFASLGLSPDASDAEVKDSYLRLAREFHPDIVDDSDMSPEEKQLTELQFKLWTNSYNSIRTERSRQRE